MSVFDWDEGYDFDDPKHSLYAEAMRGFGDYLRKAEKENPPAEDDECDCSGCAA